MLLKNSCLVKDLCFLFIYSFIIKLPTGAESWRVAWDTAGWNVLSAASVNFRVYLGVFFCGGYGSILGSMSIRSLSQLTSFASQAKQPATSHKGTSRAMLQLDFIYGP